MSAKPKVSVVIPIYGVEAYIERCARSLFEQTIESVEYIFVNDCTPDHSVDILKSVLEEYPHRKASVVIIDLPQNKGLPNARKCGLSYVTGEYVIHCDSDDWPERDMYERLYNIAHDEDIDIVECDFYINSTSRESYKCLAKPSYLHYTPYLTNKMVKRSLYDNDILYPVANMIEDITLVIQLYYYAQRIKHIKKAYYHYWLNEDSITGVRTEMACINRCNDFQKNISVIESFIVSHSICEEYKTDLIYLKFHAKTQLTPLLGQSQYRKMWRNLYREINVPFFFSRISIKIKVLFLARLLGVKYQTFGR